MTLTVAVPMTASLMVAVAERHGVVSCQSFHDCREKPINVFAVARSGLDSFVVALECSGSFNRPHSNQP